MTERIAVVGLGYVGLPVAMSFAEKFGDTVGFDISGDRVDSLRRGVDETGEVASKNLTASRIRITSDADELQGATFFVVAVPTPIDGNNQPDLSSLLSASEIVGRALTPGAVVVYESTVYPGLTEDICGPVLARVSGLQQGTDFKLGYSPERINPGDPEHTIDRVVKVVSGEDGATLERVAAAYQAIVSAGIYRAPSIKVAEAAKVIENTQRDLNIALMNELALICGRLGISTKDVLAAAGTKWNFLSFTPGLVGGHCIGVDPYYLTHKAQELGYHPQVILAGRQINDEMGLHVARSFVKLLMHSSGGIAAGIRVAILGLTFKENVGDIRNSRVPDIIHELREYGIEPLVHDPLADPAQARERYGIDLVDWSSLTELDGVIFVVPHRFYLEMAPMDFLAELREAGVIFDVKSALDPTVLPERTVYSAL